MGKSQKLDIYFVKHGRWKYSKRLMDVKHTYKIIATFIRTNIRTYIVIKMPVFGRKPFHTLLASSVTFRRAF